MEDLINQLGLALIAVLVPLAIAGVKRILPGIPKMWLPVLAGALGPLFDVAIAYVAGIEGQGLLAVGAGLAGVGLRELKDQLGKAIVPPSALRCAPAAVAAALAIALLAGCAGLTDTAQGKLDVAKATYASAVKAMTEAAAAGAFDDATIVRTLEPARAAARAAIDAAEAAIGAPDFAGKAEAAFNLAVELEAIYRKVRHGNRERTGNLRAPVHAGAGIRRAGLRDPCTGDPRGTGALAWRARAA